VTGCCPPRGYDVIFDERQARRDLRRWRRKGLATDARGAVEFLAARGVRSVLEPGGGVGAVQVELLRRGCERAVNVELSPGYERVAGELLRAEGLEQRVERRVGDFVEEAPGLPRADAVVLNRVVCCYPDDVALLSAAAGDAERFVVWSYPRDSRLHRAVAALGNLGLRLARREFRAYVHPRRRMLATLEGAGFREVLDRAGPVWRVTAVERLR
jgi:hypothetical protein